MRAAQVLHPAAQTHTSAVLSLSLSLATLMFGLVIRSHHDTIKSPHFRLISRFQPKTHLHSLRGVTQTDLLQKHSHFLTNS